MMLLLLITKVSVPLGKTSFKVNLLLLFKLICSIFLSTHMTTGDGVANNSIRYIYQDSKGFIWMGTLNAKDIIQDDRQKQPYQQILEKAAKTLGTIGSRRLRSADAA